MAKLTKEAFIEALKSMNLLEIKELVEGIKEEFGVDPSSITTSTTNNLEAKNETVEKTQFKVILKTFKAENKIKIIKEILTITDLNIIGAKKLTETPNAVIKEDVKKEEAENIKKKLEELGATIELD